MVGDLSDHLLRNRLVTHFFRRLLHSKTTDLMAAAVERGILHVKRFEHHKSGCLKFVPSDVGVAAEAISALGEHDLYGGKRRHSFVYSDGEIVVSEDFPSSRLKYSGSKEITLLISEAQKRNATDRHIVPSNLPSMRDITRELRNAAVSLSAADVATLLLLSEGVGSSGQSLKEILSLLKRPRPIITLYCDVDGFEEQLVSLFKRGLILPGESIVTQLGDTSSRAEIRSAEMRNARRHAICIYGSLYSADTFADALFKASEGRLPIVCVSEFRNSIPKTLEASANLRIVCPSLTASLVAETITVVTGERPSQALHESDLELIGLDDISMGISAGNSADDAISHLAEIAKVRRKIVEGSRPQKAKLAKPSNGGVLVLHKDLERSAVKAIEDMSGYPQELLEWSSDLKSDLELWQDGQLAWEEVGASLLLSGPPGTGKTVFAQALARSIGIPLLQTSVSIWLKPSYLGPVLKRITDSFTEAASHSPAILFVDEIDGIGTRGSRDKEFADYWNSVVNCFLEALNGSQRAPGVIVVGATNRPLDIDPALRRSGRLKPHIEIGLPDRTALIGIYRQYLAGDLPHVVETAQLPRRQPRKLGQTADRPNERRNGASLQ